ncbi:U3 snoRNP protein [Tulasnella sp. 417]|nr:U3 snoRNP protein [Tulasnella sp. 417]
MIRYDGLACIVDTPTGQVQTVLEPSPEGYKALATFLSLSQNAERLAVGNPGSIIIWDLSTATIVWRLEDSTTSRVLEGVLTGMKLSGNGQFVAYVTSHKVVHVWDTATDRRQPLVGTQPDPQRYAGAWPIAISFDGRYTAVASVHSSIGIYSSKTGELLEVLSGHKGAVAQMAWSLDGSRLLSGSWDKSAKLWDVSLLQNLDETGPSSLKISLTDSASVSGPFSRRGSVCRMTYAAKDPVEWVFMARDESWYVSCSADGDLNFWDPKSGVSELKMKLKGWQNNAEHFDLGPISAISGGWLAVTKGHQSSIWRYSVVEKEYALHDEIRP